jgi:hypothetical protein
VDGKRVRGAQSKGRCPQNGQQKYLNEKKNCIECSQKILNY